MARCPNCGSSVRTGAKFCTTCGFRLPLDAPVEQEPTAGRSPFDTTSSATVASRWPTGPAEAPAATAGDEPPSEHGVVGEAVSEEAPEPEADEQEAAPAQGAEEPPVEPSPFTGWPAFGSVSDSTESWDARPTDEPEEPGWDRDGDQQAVEEAIASWSAEADTDEDHAQVEERQGGPYSWLSSTRDESAPVADAEVGAEPPLEEPGTEPAAEAQSAAETPTPVELDDLQPVPAAPSTDEQAPPTTGPLPRAVALLDELRELLGQIEGAASGTPAPVVDVAAELERIRAEDGPESEEIQALRAAVASAQARPRDVDIMLDLVSRAEAMAEIIRGYDRYRDAIDSAISALRGEKGEEPPRRW